MHTTMSNLNYEENWKKFLKCKECWEFKELNNENWYKHKQWFMWVLWRCKECIKRWRKSEHELVMARIYDKNRYYNNKSRRKYILDYSSKNKKERWLSSIHSRTDNCIHKHWLRPDCCSVCWLKHNRIVAHHPNYLKWYEVVFVCPICHSKIHLWKIQCPKPIKLLPF